jgi:ribosome recycling factor
MREEVKMYIDDAVEHMVKAIEHLEQELTKIRAGKASPNMLTGINVDYYGTKSPISQSATINNQDAKTLIIKPWDKSMLEPIEKAILAANIGITPQSDGEIIRLVLPPLTEERRKDLVKTVRQIGEQSKISVRNIRRDAMTHVKSLLKEGLSEDMEKDAEAEIQKLTNDYTVKIDNHLNAKEKEILTV